jgi:hypothetical protein
MPKTIVFFKNQCSTRLQCQQGFMPITKNQIYISNQSIARQDGYPCKHNRLQRQDPSFHLHGIAYGNNQAKLGCFHVVNLENQENANINIHISFIGRKIANGKLSFSLLPAYLLCTLRIPKAVIVQMDKYRKHCLWRGVRHGRQKTTTYYLVIGMQTKNKIWLGHRGSRKTK